MHSCKAMASNAKNYWRIGSSRKKKALHDSTRAGLRPSGKIFLPQGGDEACPSPDLAFLILAIDTPRFHDGILIIIRLDQVREANAPATVEAVEPVFGHLRDL